MLCISIYMYMHQFPVLVFMLCISIIIIHVYASISCVSLVDNYTLMVYCLVEHTIANSHIALGPPACYCVACESLEYLSIYMYIHT